MASSPFLLSLFWISVLAIAYTYAGYPLLIALIARRGGPPMPAPSPGSAPRPEVLVLLVAHDEASRIVDKLENLRASTYPANRLHIVVALDGCGERTASLVQQSIDRWSVSPRVECQSFPEKQGKASIINQVVSAAVEPLVVFCDVRQRFEPEAIGHLVENFADPRVGAVSGELYLLPRSDSPVSAGSGLYWRYEKFIRKSESRVHSTLGTTGAIYALRRELFSPIPVNTIVDDLVIPLRVVAQGYRVLFDGRARAYDGVAKTPSLELARKLRTLTGNFQAFAQLGRLFHPWRSPVALQFFSHKLLRVLVPYFLIGAFLSSWALAVAPFYQAAFYLQAIVYELGILGFLVPGLVARLGRARILFQLPQFFLLLNLAALGAAFSSLFGVSSGSWDSTPADSITPISEPASSGPKPEA